MYQIPLDRAAKWVRRIVKQDADMIYPVSTTSAAGKISTFKVRVLKDGAFTIVLLKTPKRTYAGAAKLKPGDSPNILIGTLLAEKRAVRNYLIGEGIIG